MTLHRKKRHKDRIWSWREGGRIRSLKRQGVPDNIARAIASAEFAKRKTLAALLGSKIEQAAELAISSLPGSENDLDGVRFHLVIPDCALEDDEDRETLQQFLQAAALH